jgi:hypothetical protein
MEQGHQRALAAAFVTQVFMFSTHFRFCSLLHRVSHLSFEIPKMFLSCSLGVIVVQCARPGWISGSDTGNTLSRGSACHSREWGTTILAIWLI